ncbi:YceI family protein [Helicobacter sp.]|uniref:YceI family protein n=1 Tax=Helicobacter sp. TaxID=218 RepID=UPI0025BF7334|nr:YceI family protein [Helicobacter sp.]MCI5969295.1 YceI family protein [Helicobacter sp.]MDY2585549.1 YceI family protein [Helicobacter sp.]
MKKFFLTSSLLAALSLPVLAAPYQLDTTNSKVGFTIKKKGGLVTVNGEFKTFAGEIDYDGAKLNVFSGEIDVASVDTKEQKRDNELRSSDVFDAQKFPKMTFKMAKYEAGKIHGDLTIKDVTKQVTLNAEEKLNGNVLEISANGMIKRSDFDLEWGVFQNVLVSDDVVINLNLKANAK